MHWPSGSQVKLTPQDKWCAPFPYLCSTDSYLLAVYLFSSGARCVLRQGDSDMAEPRTIHQRLLTLGQLAERLDVSTHRLKYALDQYRIAPAARVGIIRVWSEDAIPLIESALRRIAANKGGLR